MPIRPGDPTVEVEGRVEVTTAKAYLVETTMGKINQVWIPKSQVLQMTDPDENGNRVFTVSLWWYNKSELGE